MGIRITIILSLSIYLISIIYPLTLSACLVHEVTVDTFKNGNIKTSRTFCGDVLLSESHFVENGNLLIYKDYFWSSHPFGFWYKYSKYGEVIDSGSFIANHEESKFIGNHFSGLFESFYDNGKLQFRVSFEKGIINGKWMSFYDSGNISLEGYVISGRNMINWKSYLENGTLYSASIENYPFTHLWYYNEEGNIKEEHIKKHNVRYVIRTFYGNNRIESEFVHDSTIANYSKVSFYINGIPRSNNTYVDGKHNGLSIMYYENGNIKSKGECDGFHKIGRWIWYFDDGKVERILDFGKLSRKNGDFIEYYKNGNLKRKAKFIDGNIDSDYFEYNENGEISIHIQKDIGLKYYDFKFWSSGPDGISFELVKKK